MSGVWYSASGSSNILKPTYINGFLDVSNMFLTRGDASMAGNVYIGGTAGLNLNNSMTMSGIINQLVSSPMIGNTVYFGGNVINDSYVGGRLYVTNDISTNSRLFVRSDVSFNSRLFVKDDVSLNGDLFVGSDVSFNSRLFVKDDVSFNGDLFVGSDVSFNSRLFVNSDLSMNGNLSIGKDLTITGNLSVKQYSTKLTIYTVNYNNFTVAEDMSLNGRLYLNGDASMIGNVYMQGGISVGGTPNTGTSGGYRLLRLTPPSGSATQITFDTSTASGTGQNYIYSDNTKMEINSPLTDFQNGIVKVSNTSASTDTTTGALRVNGGVGITGSLFSGQNGYFSNIIARNPTQPTYGTMIMEGGYLFATNYFSGFASFYTNNAAGTGGVKRIGYIGNAVENGWIELYASSADANGYNALGYKTNKNFVVDGKLGIGTTNPLVPLHVIGSARILNSSGNGVNIGTTELVSQKALNIFVDDVSNNSVIQSIWQGNSYRPLLLNPVRANDGYVGIGTTNPVNCLQIQGSSATAHNKATDTGADHNLLLSSTKTGSTMYAMALGVDFTSGCGYINAAGNSNLQPVCLQTRGGNVGIGITNPTVPLSVAGSGTSSRSGNHKYTDAAVNYGTATVTTDISIGAQLGIECNFIRWYSDIRIKTNINPIVNPLEKLRKLKCCEYDHIDKQFVSKTRFGFIAQEVYEVLPNSVGDSIQYIPNIYEFGEINNKIITLTNKTTHDICGNLMLQIVDNNKDLFVTIDEIIDNKSFSIKLSDNQTIDSSNNKIFIYGQEVKDFKSINYNEIFTLTTASVKELDKELQTEKNKREELENIIKSQQSQIDLLINRLTALEQR